jgi:hypothetical protein
MSLQTTHFVFFFFHFLQLVMGDARICEVGAKPTRLIWVLKFGMVTWFLLRQYFGKCEAIRWRFI